MTRRNIGQFQMPEDRGAMREDRDTELIPRLSAGGGRRIHHHGAPTGQRRWPRLGVGAAQRWRLTTAAMATEMRRDIVPGVRRAIGPEASPRQRWIVALSVVVPVALVGVACASYQSGPTTARVTRASVSSKVTGTGALRSISQQNLGFDKGGKLTELDVAVGQQVNAGQVLARVDDFEAQTAVRKAQAELSQEQAKLDRIRDAEKVAATSDDAKGAKDIQDDTEKQAKDLDRANEKSIEEAESQLSAARDDLRRAEAAHDADDYRCSRSIGGDSRRKPGEVHQPNGLKGELFVPAPVESSACERARKSEAGVDVARSNVSDAQVDVEHARQRRAVERSRQQVAIDNAKREARAADHEATDAERSRPHDLAEQEAAIQDAQTEVDTANRAVQNTVLRAPVAGKVAAINGTVGEYVSAGSETTPLAPGGRVPLPDVTSGAGSRDDSGDKAERPGGASFLVLDDVNTFQVVVPFEEADAAKIQPNQQVDVTFDSVPGVTRKGTVVSVSPTGTSIKDVTNYYVTIVLNELDPRLKDGQTAQASVIVGQVPEVLVVPNSAVQQGGQSGLVTVVDPDGKQRQVQVQLGMVGDGVTQVVAGLREGQEVVSAES